MKESWRMCLEALGRSIVTYVLAHVFGGIARVLGGLAHVCQGGMAHALQSHCTGIKESWHMYEGVMGSTPMKSITAHVLGGQAGHMCAKEA